MKFITDNLSTILLSLGLLALVLMVVRGMVRSRKNGGAHCASCAGCPGAASCAQKTTTGEAPPR